MPLKQVLLQQHVFFSATQKGEKPQEAAFQRAREEKHSFFVSLEVGNNHLFSSFHDKEAFWDFYEVFRGRRCFSQLNRSVDLNEHSSALYLDIKWVTKVPDEHAESKVLKIRNALGVPTLVEVLSRPTKNGTKQSFHLYAPSMRFKNNALIKDWLQREVWSTTLQQDPDMYTSEGEPIIDFGVYTRNRAFRIPGSSKSDDYKEMKLPEKDFFMATVLSEPLPANFAWDDSEPAAKKRRQMELLKKLDRRENAQCSSTAVLPLLKDLLKSLGDEKTELSIDSKGTVRGQTCGERRCLVAGELNHHDNCVLFVRDNGDVWYHCYDCEAHPYFAGKKIGNIWHDRTKVVDGVFVGTEPLQQLWGPKVSITVHEEQRLETIEPKLTTRCYVIAAPMGSGKTYQSRILVPQFARVLVVSTRMVLSHSQIGFYPTFSHYKEQNYSADQLVIQYESLHNLIQERPFDLVLLDETRSLMSNTVCLETNKGSIDTNMKMLQAFMKEASLVLCMDAHMEWDAAVPTFLEDVFEENEIEVHRYVNSLQSMARELHLMDDACAFSKQIEKCVERNERVSILCRTKANALAWEKEFKEKANIAIITAETNDAVLQRFEDVNEFLREYSLLISTAKMTCGTDITLPWDKVFVDFRGAQGCCARNIIQMCGRFRTLADIQIPVLCDTVDIVYRSDVAALGAEYLATRKQCTTEYARLLSGDLEFRHDKLVYTPNCMAKIFLLEEQERLQGRHYALCAGAKKQGWNVFIHRGPGGTKDEKWEEAQAQVAADKEALDQEVFDELKDQSHEQVEAFVLSAEQAIQNQESDHAMKRKCCIANILKLYPASSLTFEDLQFAEKHRYAIANYAFLYETNYNWDDLVRHEVRDLNKKKKWWTDTCGIFGVLQMHKIAEALFLLGIDTIATIDDVDAFKEIPKALFLEHSNQIKKLMFQCACAGRRRDVRDRNKTAVGALRRELMLVLGLSLTRKRDKAKNQNVVYVLAKEKTIARLAHLGNFHDHLTEIHEELRRGKTRIGDHFKPLARVTANSCIAATA